MKRRRFNKRKKSLGKFKSPLEKEIYDSLVRRKSKKFNFQYEGEKLKYFTSHDYMPDIVLTFPGGKKIYVEIKGYLRYEDQRKMRAVKEANPDLDIRFVFPETGRVGRSKMTPEEWCDKYEFPCTMTGDIPKEWTLQSQPQRSAKAVNSKRAKQISTLTVTEKTDATLTASSA